MKKYIKPAIKARAINTESVMAGSDPKVGGDVNDLKNTTDQLPTDATMNGGQAKRFDIWGE